jgi:ribonuclease HI
MAILEIFSGGNFPTEDNEEQGGGWAYTIKHSWKRKERGFGYLEGENLYRLHLISLIQAGRALKRAGDKIMIYTENMDILNSISKPWFIEAVEKGKVSEDADADNKDLWNLFLKTYRDQEFKFARVRDNVPLKLLTKKQEQHLFEEFQKWNGKVFDYRTFFTAQETNIETNTLAYYQIYEPAPEDLLDKDIKQLLKDNDLIGDVKPAPKPRGGKLERAKGFLTFRR